MNSNSIADEAAAVLPEVTPLLTDVVMPGMNGHQLARRLSAVRPSVQVLFMSGYTADVIAQRGIQNQDMVFIAKPFSRNELAHVIHAMLGIRAVAAWKFGSGSVVMGRG